MYFYSMSKNIFARTCTETKVNVTGNFVTANIKRKNQRK